jgi:hypothetical protein
MGRRRGRNTYDEDREEDGRPTMRSKDEDGRPRQGARTTTGDEDDEGDRR